MRQLAMRFWNDDDGALLAAEWLCLAGMTVLGVAAGANSVRNSITNEFDQFNRTLRAVGPSSGVGPGLSRVGAGSADVGGYPAPSGALPRLTSDDLPIL